jgi:FAD synthase
MTILRSPTHLHPTINVQGSVVPGFQRGRLLGWPTANIDPNQWNNNNTLLQGVYFGWASIQSDHTVRKAVLSIGNNPTFENKHVSLEVYICHEYGRDFYGEDLKLLICGYLRGQEKISWEDLKQAISDDVSVSEDLLDLVEYALHREDVHFEWQPKQ